MKASLLFIAALAIAGCNQQSKATDATREPSADNTKKNERDRLFPSNLTPGDQGSSEADRGITQAIRREVVSDSSLSTTAKNVKIITIDGVVTLRGPVANENERKTVIALARNAAGVKGVDDTQLEVASN